MSEKDPNDKVWSKVKALRNDLADPRPDLCSALG